MLSIALILRFVQAEDVNRVVSPGIYDSIKNIINANEKYTDDVECMTTYLIDNNIVKQIYEPGLSRNMEKLKRELEPYLVDAKESCENGSKAGWFSKIVSLVKSCFTGSETDE